MNALQLNSNLTSDPVSSFLLQNKHAKTITKSGLFAVGCVFIGTTVLTPIPSEKLEIKTTVVSESLNTFSGEHSSKDSTVGGIVMTSNDLGYTVIRSVFSEEWGTKGMGVNDNDKIIKKPIHSSHQQVAWTKYVKEKLKGSREFTKEESKMHSELLNDLSEIVERFSQMKHRVTP